MSKRVKLGNEILLEENLSLIKGKKVGLVTNHTGVTGDLQNLANILHSHAEVDLTALFSPEHGLYGHVYAEGIVESSVDKNTNLPVYSLYPHGLTDAMLKNIDVILFDLWDIGARYFTYIYTMAMVLEAAGKMKLPVFILDRPNPNGYYVDGPVLQKEYASFVGLHPVPIVYGLTIAEYATMVNGEGWLKDGVKCNLKYITVDDYNHSYYYILPVQTSPNLPNMDAVYLYPSLCLFEGTVISVGRGTDFPFQVFGHPLLKKSKSSFVPQSNSGSANPLYKGDTCYGYKLNNFSESYIRSLGQLYLFWLQETCNELKDPCTFFNSYFDKLAGNSVLKQQIISGMSEEDIRKSWQSDLVKYKEIRKKYLLYPDFD